MRKLLHPIATRRTARAERFLEIERHEYMEVIERRRRALDEEVARRTREHNQRMAGNVQAPGLLESALLPVRLDYLRALIADHVEIRKRLGQECPELLALERLNTLEEEMIRTVDTFRVARDDDFKRRVAASGMPQARSPYRDDAEYGDVVAMVRREVQKLRLGQELGRDKQKKRLGAAEKIGIAAVVVAAIGILLTFLVPEVRVFVGLERPMAQQKTK